MAGTVERCLREQGYALVPIRGTSMYPLLREGGSRVQLERCSGEPLGRGDVILYRRPDGTLVLHRIVRLAEPGAYLACGDHQWRPLERVTEEQILAVARGFFRNGRYFDEHTRWYQLYQLLWNRSLTVRRCCLAILRLCGLEHMH